VHEASYGVRSADVDERGNVAWISSREVSDPVLEVHFKALGENGITIASDADIVPESVALTEPYVYWQSASGAHVVERPDR
jgi:hypothetical protein